MTHDLTQRLDAMRIPADLWVRDEDGTRLYPALAGGEMFTTMTLGSKLLLGGAGALAATQMYMQYQQGQAMKGYYGQMAAMESAKATLQKENMRGQALQIIQSSLGDMATATANFAAGGLGPPSFLSLIHGAGVRGAMQATDQGVLLYEEGMFQAAGYRFQGRQAVAQSWSDMVGTAADFAMTAAMIGSMPGKTTTKDPLSGFKKGTGFSVDPSSIRYGYQPIQAYTVPTMKTPGLQQFAARRTWAW